MKITYTEKPGSYTNKKTGAVQNCVNTSVRIDADVILVNFDEKDVKATASGELLAHTYDRHSLWMHRKVEFAQLDLGQVCIGMESDGVTLKYGPRQGVFVATCDEPKSNADYLPLYDADENGKAIFNLATGIRKYERTPAMAANDMMAAFLKVPKS